jgi:hypothetical protein
MIKLIRLKEINRQGQRIRTVREPLNSNNNSYQTMGALALDPKTAKTKELFQMFNLN